MTNQEARQREAAIQAALDASDLARAAELAERYRQAAGDGAPAGDPAASLPFRADYQTVRVAVASGQLTPALERVEPLLGQTPRLPNGFACHIHLLAAEALARLGRQRDARKQLELATRWPKLLEDDPFLRVCELRIRLWLGEVRQLDDSVAGCAQALTGPRNRANHILLLADAGRAWDREGDLGRAEQYWMCAKDLVEAAPLQDPIHADVFLQLGRLAHQRGRLPEALNWYDRAEALARKMPAQVLNVQLRRLWVLVDLNQEDQARTAWRDLCGPEARSTMPDEVRVLADLLGSVLGEVEPAVGTAEAQGYRAIRHGELKRACDRYRAAFATEPAPERRARLAIMLALLLTAREQGRTDSATTPRDSAEAPDHWLGVAEELARSADLPEVLWRALRLRGQHVLDRDGDEERARALFEEAAQVMAGQAHQLRNLGQQLSYQAQGGDVLLDLLLAACRRGDAARVFHFQELLRGRLVRGLLLSAPDGATRDKVAVLPELLRLNARIDEVEGAQADLPATARASLGRLYGDLLRQRDRLWEGYLCDRARPGDSALPLLPTLAELERALPAGTVYVAPHLFDHDLYLLVVRRNGSRVLRSAGSGELVRRQLEEWGQSLAAQVERYEKGLGTSADHRRVLDSLLAGLGEGPLGTLLQDAWHGGRSGERLVWAPGPQLCGLPVAALRRQGRYLVQDHEVVNTFSGGLLLHHAGLPRPARWRRRRALAVTAPPPEVIGVDGLPFAQAEGAVAAAAFAQGETLHYREATRNNIVPHLPRVGVAHFACHSYFDSEHPLASWIRLPSDERWYGPAWLGENVEQLPLVTLSTCNSAAVAPAVGGEVFGLVSGLLASGVRAVMGGICRIPDRETAVFMWRFYRETLTHDLAGALAQAQRDTLAEGDASPLYWAIFVLFGDAAALPGPRWPWRWLARWRRRRYTRNVPIPGADAASAQ
jgi:tetratricopeptide (TPR) repeat protein